MKGTRCFIPNHACVSWLVGWLVDKHFARVRRATLQHTTLHGIGSKHEEYGADMCSVVFKVMCSVFWSLGPLVQARRRVSLVFAQGRADRDTCGDAGSLEPDKPSSWKSNFSHSKLGGKLFLAAGWLP